MNSGAYMHWMVARPPEKTPRRVLGGLVVAHAVPPPVGREHVHRIRASGALVGEVHELVGPVARDLQPRHDLVARLERLPERREARAFRALRLFVVFLLDTQLLRLVRADLEDVLEVAPVHAAPRDALLARARERDLAHAGLDLLRRVAVRPHPRAGLGVLRRDLLAAERHLRERAAREQVGPAAEDERVDRVRRRGGRRPVLRLLLLEQPHVAGVGARLVSRDLAERLDDERLRRDGRREEAAREEVRALPVHPELVGENAALLDGGEDFARERLLAAALQRGRGDGLRLEPEVRPLRAEVLDEELRVLPVLRRRHPRERVQVEPAHVEAVHAEGDLLLLRKAQAPLHVLRDLAVERLRRVREEVRVVHLREAVEAREPGEDVERDGIGRRPAREPRPEAVVVARLAQLPEAALLLGREALASEELAQPRAGGGLVLRLAHPRRRLERDGLELRVRFQRALERLRAGLPPGVERCADARVGARDERAERVRVVAREGLLAALVRELHQIREREHRVPRRTRHGAHLEPRVADRVRARAREEVREREGPGFGAARVELHRLAHEDAPREDGQHALLAVGELRPLRLGDVFQEAAAVGDRDAELEGLRLAGSELEGLGSRRRET